MNAARFFRGLPIVGRALEQLVVMAERRRADALRIYGRRVPIYGAKVERGADFASRRRSGDVTHAVVHESAGRAATMNPVADYLRGKGYGVHIGINPDGSVVQYNDLRDRLIHAGGLNGPSVGIELVSPYYPHNMKRGGAWSDVIPARWAHKGEYVLPPRAQLEALVSVLRCLHDASLAGAVHIPLAWPGLDGHGRIAMGRIESPRAKPGIHGHIYSGHADGGFPVLYAYLRIEMHMMPDDAYASAVDAARGAGQQVRLPE